MSAGSNRREFLTGRALQKVVGAAGESLADAIVSPPPSRGPNLVLRTTAMACDFDVILNPDGPEHQVRAASEALDQVQALEEQYSVYRPDSELSRLNRIAAIRRVQVEPGLYRLLRRAATLAGQTDGAFNPAAGALIQLWRRSRSEDRLPDATELEAALACCDLSSIQWDDADCSLRFGREGLGFDLGAIGKGYAVDEAARVVQEQGVEHFLVHGGKSSVLAAVAGLLRPQRGAVEIGGETLLDTTRGVFVPPERRRCAVVFQDARLFPHMSVATNLRYGLSRAPAGEDGPGFDEVVELLGLAPLLARRPRGLSGGERQMLALARALMADPALLILDEPSAGLSPAAVDLIFAKIAEINEGGVAVLMVEQNARRALAMSHRGYVLDGGQNRFEGTGPELLHDPKVVDLYLGGPGAD